MVPLSCLLLRIKRFKMFLSDQYVYFVFIRLPSFYWLIIPIPIIIIPIIIIININFNFNFNFNTYYSGL